MTKRERVNRQSVSPQELRLRYLMTACYFYFRAADADENLVSSLNRTAARQVALELTRRGIAVPNAEEIHAYAAEKWPEDRLHPLSTGNTL